MTTEEETILDDLMNISAGLSGKEIDFLDDIHNRNEAAGEDGNEYTLSEKQSDWLHAIARRVGLED